jgi:hypothetical protein
MGVARLEGILINARIPRCKVTAVPAEDDLEHLLPIKFEEAVTLLSGRWRGQECPWWTDRAVLF